MMRILIGYNGSDAANTALHELRYAGFPDNTEAVVLTIAESWVRPSTPAEATYIATAGKDTLCKTFPAWTVTAETALGTPPDALLERAEILRPDLLIIGQPQQSNGAEGVFIGRTLETILQRAQSSVHISRTRDRSNSRHRKILLAFDGSAGAAKAVDAIARRKWPLDAEVRLLAVADSSLLTSIGRFTPQMMDATVEAKLALQWAETLAAASLKKLIAAGISPSVEVRFGSPKEVIIDEAAKWNADTIFVATTAPNNPFGPSLIGAVSAFVAARSHCSVEIITSRA